MGLLLHKRLHPRHGGLVEELVLIDERREGRVVDKLSRRRQEISRLGRSPALVEALGPGFEGKPEFELLRVRQLKGHAHHGVIGDAPGVAQFLGQTDKLPYDQHWLVALVAPRAFVVLDGTQDICLPSAVRQSLRGARPVYDLYGAADRLGVNYEDHKHGLTPEDWRGLMDFADWQLRGMKPARHPRGRRKAMLRIAHRCDLACEIWALRE